MTQPIALITGGARGIGYACAEALKAEGHRIVLADIDAAALSESVVATPRPRTVEAVVPSAFTVFEMASAACAY